MCLVWIGQHEDQIQLFICGIYRYLVLWLCVANLSPVDSIWFKIDWFIDLAHTTDAFVDLQKHCLMCFFKQSLFIVCTCNEKLLPSFFSPHEMFKKLLKQELCGHNLFHSITPRVYDVADQQRWCAFSSWFCKPSWIVPSSMHSVWNLSHPACGSAIYNIE